MSHSWIRTVDDDFLRADDIRQMNIASELHAVLSDGRQFLIAEIGTRSARMQVAEELASAMADAHRWTHASVICVVGGDEGWTVEIRPMRSSESAHADPPVVAED